MSLSEDIGHYKNTSLVNLNRIRKYYESLAPDEAIKKAAQGMDPDGELNSHQHRLGYHLCDLSSKIILSKEYKIRIHKAKTFMDIFAVTEEIRLATYKLGDLWSYDTALRIAFNKHNNENMLPDTVFVQCGVREGVKKIFNGRIPKGRSLPVDMFPRELRQLKPYQIENFLCTWAGAKKSKRPC
ncbi:MAG: hypothetical protein JST75_03760 [Bacteroidetes bacterium]|nr:hypothetical protein [Bacteroidota bacterium]